jgi:hypothetical protein
MSPAAALLSELAAHGIELRAEGERLRFRPAAAMTGDLAERVKACKPELITLLSGGPEAPADGRLENHADREWRRFLGVAVPSPKGMGWHDPGQTKLLDVIAVTRWLNSKAPPDLDPDRPGPLDVLSPDQFRRYRAARVACGDGPPSDLHAAAWRAAVVGGLS